MVKDPYAVNASAKNRLAAELRAESEPRAETQCEQPPHRVATHVNRAAEGIAYQFARAELQSDGDALIFGVSAAMSRVVISVQAMKSSGLPKRSFSVLSERSWYTSFAAERRYIGGCRRF
jgi:hypothetical protein